MRSSSPRVQSIGIFLLALIVLAVGISAAQFNRQSRELEEEAREYIFSESFSEESASNQGFDKGSGEEARLSQGEGSGKNTPPVFSESLGVRVEDLRVGSGAVVSSGDMIAVDYRGMLEDGSVFDSSYAPGRDPFQFRVGVGEVIAGWDRGIPGMRVGGVRKIVVPAELAYGEEGFGPIPGGATLIFEIELLSIFENR